MTVFFKFCRTLLIQYFIGLHGLRFVVLGLVVVVVSALASINEVNLSRAG